MTELDDTSSLCGQRVLVTRAAHQAAELRELLLAHGADVELLPMIELAPAGGELGVQAEALLARLLSSAYDGLLVTSANSVRFLFARLATLPVASTAPHWPTVFAIGPATAEALREQGVANVQVATRAIGEGLIECVLAHFGSDVIGKRFLLPRAREAREVVVEALTRRGATVDVAVLYETTAVTHGPDLPARALDWVTFASPSAVHAFAARFALPPGARVAVIGPVTAQAVDEHGWSIDAMPREHTLAAMVAAMSDAAKRRNDGQTKTDIVRA